MLQFPLYYQGECFDLRDDGSIKNWGWANLRAQDLKPFSGQLDKYVYQVRSLRRRVKELGNKNLVIGVMGPWKAADSRGDVDVGSAACMRERSPRM